MKAKILMNVKTVKKVLSQFYLEDRGQSLILVALAMTMLLGITAFTTDIGYLFWQKRHLQNTADAGALAGARELIDGDTSQIDDVVSKYVDAHGLDEAELDNINIENPQVTVELKGNRNLFFARILGMETADIRVRATARVGSIEGINGLIPIGIKENVLSGDTSCGEGLIIITKDNFGNWEDEDENNEPGSEGENDGENGDGDGDGDGKEEENKGSEIGPGNWGWVNLAYPENSNVHDQKKYIEEGYGKVIKIGDTIETDPGANIGATKHLNDLKPILEGYIDDDNGERDTLFIPVLKEKEGSGNYQVEIVGFAAIRLTDYEGKSSKLVIEAEYDSEKSIFASGSKINFDEPGFNLKGIALVE